LKNKITMILKIGSKGEDVKKLQQKLGLGADGVFGPGTEKAVKKWQIDHNLGDDGIVGEGTWNKMFGEQTLITEPSIPQTPIASVGLLGSMWS
jgi:peptidoglycan hydrolase-like protein with peptidoglycan-binding domain